MRARKRFLTDTKYGLILLGSNALIHHELSYARDDLLHRPKTMQPNLSNHQLPLIKGAHSLAVGDVDGDGCDETVYGSCCIDHDGTVLYRTGLGHGDALHLGDFNPDREGLEVFMVHEEKSSAYGFEMRDAKTGKIPNLIYNLPTISFIQQKSEWKSMIYKLHLKVIKAQSLSK